MGKQKNQNMSKISNILFFTIILCAHFAINSKNLKNKKEDLKTSKHVDVGKPLTFTKPERHISLGGKGKPDIFKKPEIKVAAPIARKKFNKYGKKTSYKRKTVAPKVKKIAPPKKNKKLGQYKKKAIKAPTTKQKRAAAMKAKKFKKVAKKAAPKVVAKKKNLRKAPINKISV